MVRAYITIPDEKIRELESLASMTSDIIDGMLEAGGRVGVKALRTELSAVIGQGLKYDTRSTGELINSIGVTPPQTDSSGVRNVKIGFNEPRQNQYSQNTSSKGRKTRSRTGHRSYEEITNRMIAATIEYGKRKANQPPKPFMKRAKLKSKQPIRDAMEEDFVKEVSE